VVQTDDIRGSFHDRAFARGGVAGLHRHRLRVPRSARSGTRRVGAPAGAGEL